MKSLPSRQAATQILAPTTAPDAVVSSIIALPGETQEEAEQRVAKAKADKEARAAAEREDKERIEKEKAEKAKKDLEVATQAASVAKDLCAEFASGNKQGDDLAKWCKEQGALLPKPFDLLKTMLDTNEKSEPDITCAWAAPEKWGAALCMLGEDNEKVQMQFMYAAQEFCRGIGFPKPNNVSTIRKLFEGMYQHDICETEGQLAYKEDENPEFEEGKTKVIIQTIAWFNFLEEDDDDDDSNSDSD